jgi:flagellar FliL protein
VADQNNKGSKILVLLLALNTLAMAGTGGVVAYYFLVEKEKEKLSDLVNQQSRDLASKDQDVYSLEPRRVFELNTFTANLANPRVDKYIRIRVELGLSDSVSEQEIERKKSQIRDEIITSLNTKRDKELLTAQGKDALKKEIRGKLNNIVETGEIKDVLFTDFLIN